MSERMDGDSGAVEGARGSRTLRDRARNADASDELVATAKLIRRLLPGDESSAEVQPPSRGGRVSATLSKEIAARLAPGEPSAMREVGLGVLQAWQALSEAQRRRRGTTDTAILFTDLVGFSSWALEAGDEAAVKLLRRVGSAEEDAISERGGILVKRLGDGSMAVFGDPDQAVRAAHDMQERIRELEADGFALLLRAGVHLGRPQKVGRDYLGVDVNVAARVGDAAQGGEILATDAACALLDPDEFEIGAARPLDAAGAPEELTISAVQPRHDKG